MTTNAFWMARTAVAGVLLAAGTAWGQEAVPSAAEEVPAVAVEVPAPAEGCVDPLEGAAARGAREALAVLRDGAREALSPEAVESAVLEAVLRAGDPGVGFDVPQAGQWECGMVLVGTEGLPRVAFVAEGGAAAAAGIAAGDFIVEVGGEAVADGADLSGVRAALGGGDAAALSVAVEPADGGERKVAEIERKARGDWAAEVVAERLPTGIGYVWMPWVGEGMADGFSRALGELGEVAGLVVDLRGAGGASASAVAGIAQRFALPGKILYRTDEDSEGAATVAAGAFGERFGRPAMVLVDEGTTGAAELLAAVLGGCGEGVLVIGRETSGNPLVRGAVELPDGRTAWLAVHSLSVGDGGMRFDGGRGLVPALEISGQALAESVYEPEEPVLRKGKSLSEEEKEDRALRDRTRHDPYLRRATDVLLGLQAIGHEWR